MKRKIWMASLAAAVLLTATAACSIGGSVRAEASKEDERNPQAPVGIINANFPDPVFQDYVAEHYDTDSDGFLSAEEIANAKTFYLYCEQYKTIATLEGIEFLSALEQIDITSDDLVEVDVSKNTALTYLHCCGESLESINVSKNIALEELGFSGIELTSIDLTNNVNLKILAFGEVSISEVDLSKNTQLVSFCGSDTKISKLDLSNHVHLEEIELGISFFPEKGAMNELILSGCTALKQIRCISSNMKRIDLTGCKALGVIDVEDNMLQSIDLSDCEELAGIAVPKNYLTSIDTSNCPHLGTLDISYNPISELDVSKNTELGGLYCRCCTRKENTSGGMLSKLDLPANRRLWHLDVSDNQLTELDVWSFRELRTLRCNDNLITEINLGNNITLLELYCGGNQLTELDLSKNPYVNDFHCERNHIRKLNLDGAERLQYLVCSDNELTELDTSKCRCLQLIYCDSNQLTSLDISKNQVMYLKTHYNKIKTLDLSAYICKDILEKNGLIASDDGTYLRTKEEEPVVHLLYFSMDWDVKLTGIGKVDIPERKVSPTPTKAPTPTPKPGDPTPTTKPGNPTVTPVPGKEPSIADFVERLYTVALNRASEPEGKAYWVKEIENGNRTGGDCAHFFLIEAEEFRNRGLNEEDFVETLYLTFFDRASEPNGKAFWVGQLKNGAMTRNQVIAGFIDSTEWCNVCANYGVKSGAPNAKAELASKNAINFATRLYTCCLGRAPEDGGLKYWSLALTNLEQTGCSAAKNFFKSDEFIGFKLKNDEYVRRLYTTFMGRDPEASEVAYWVGEIAKGTQTKDSVMAFFGQSEEFTNICKKYGIDRGTI